LVPDDAGKTADMLAKRYALEAFRQDVPETVCGESDAALVQLENVRQLTETDRVIYRANVICRPIGFLGLAQRHADVRYVVTAGLRYRLMARAPQEDFKRVQQSIAAFFQSFRVLPAEKKSP
jgi:hypothetical protein